MRQVMGNDHPYYANILNNLASLLKAQGKLTEAEPLLFVRHIHCESPLKLDITVSRAFIFKRDK